MKVVLIGMNGDIHAEGEIDPEKIMHSIIVKRNDRYYAFDIFTAGMQTAQFVEAQQPYTITEF